MNGYENQSLIMRWKELHEELLNYT